MMTFNIFLIHLILVGLFLSAWMALAWVVQSRTGNSGWVDAMWSAGTGIAGVTACMTVFFVQPGHARSVVVAVCAAIWSLRLSGHIVKRTLNGAADDPRYAKLKAQWGSNAPSEMFWFLQTQAMVSVPLVLAISLAGWNVSRPFGLQDVIAIGVFMIAIIGESVSDAQLRAFAANPANRGKVCNMGIWRWSRHPNYFFEWLTWVAFAVFAIDVDKSYDLGWFAMLAPIIMYILLTRVSGIPPLEDHMLEKYGDHYRTYQHTTSAFFPLPPTK